MKRLFNPQKTFITKLGIVLGISSTLFFGSNVMADQATNITDVDAQMDKISDFYFKNELEWKDLPEHPGAYQYIRLDSKKTNMDLDLKASNLKNLTYSDLHPEYIGENEFDNTNGSIDQTFTTAAYSHQVTNSASTSVTEGFKVGGKTTLFKLPILLTDGVDITAEFNSATSTTNTITNAKTLTASPQNIKVPAGKKYLAKVDMAKKTFNGDIEFSANGKNVKSTLNTLAMYKASGFPRPNKYPSLTFTTADMLKKLSTSQQNQVKGVTFDSSKNLILNGKAHVNGIFGSTLRVSVYDITDSKLSPELIQQKFMEQ
ncbi:ETX/MTX2 family pore-forming toxin [Bacillus thuringiensis]|uniref:ETX/MTX2 family pore-forming toxin n=1 Tax=Bacillus thuringiensis TaxID=1428 RepID=A0AAW9GIU4_BACTU|nr:ETX/MTX2 family pore-forming toxin [Bacillus thuringiensis]MDY0854372.1 ETX/MTX2 family pore-forming toxin [Bacillus thuringiensis]MDY4393638.1 ETX/MTX2 family pore-forming toxin [Bacillus thuringiensis]